MDSSLTSSNTDSSSDFDGNICNDLGNDKDVYWD